MKHTSNETISRRDFLKTLGAAGAATAGLTACAGTESSAEGGQTSIGQGEMTYRTNHNSGDKVSLLGYGMMRLPMITDPASGREIVDQDAVNDLVSYAMDHGMNYFDTSPHYGRGQSEAATGLALSRYPRDKYFIATKMSSFLEEHGDSAYSYSVDLYHKSLEYLRTDYFDYYLVHGAGIGGMDILHRRLLDNGLLDFLYKERQAGRIRNLGWSFHGDVEVFNYLLSIHDQVHWDFVQIQLNYSDWHHATGWNTNAEYLYGELASHDIPIVVMEPLLGGRLSRLPDYLAEMLKKHDPDRSVASWAFRFAGSKPNIMTVLSGMTYMEHLQENVATFSPLVPCTDEDLELLENIAALFVEYPTVPCTACGYCMPCPYGLDIPGIFTHYDKCVNEGNMPSDSGDEGYRRARRAFLVGYDRSVPRLRQANHCIGCNQCSPKCPQRINIPSEMQRIDEYVEKIKRNQL